MLKFVFKREQGLFCQAHLRLQRKQSLLMIELPQLLEAAKQGSVLPIHSSVNNDGENSGRSQSIFSQSSPGSSSSASEEDEFKDLPNNRIEPYNDEKASPWLSSSNLSEAEEETLDWVSIFRGLTTKPVVEAENDESDIYPPMIETAVTELQLEYPSKEIITGACSGQGATTSKRKKVAVKLDEAYGIDLNTLHRYSDKKQKDAALQLGASLFTLKCICGKHNILRWPPRKTKISKGTPKESIQATETTTLKDEGKIMVKVLYKDGIIVKFEISLLSTKLELEEKVAFRLNLQVGSFSIEYEDEEKEWVLVACDEDLRTCVKTSRASGKPHIVRMIVSRSGIP